MTTRSQETGLVSVRSVMRRKQFGYALHSLERILKRHRECPYLWTLRGDLIQLLGTKEGPPLKQAAVSYSKALKINPENLEALEGLAHYYDAVDPKPAKAKRYAAAYMDKARRGLSEMERIMSDGPVE